MNKLGSVTLVLECVVKEGVTHANKALLCASIELVSELLEPHPVVGVARLGYLIPQQLVYHVNVVDYIQNQGLHLDKQQVIASMLKLSIALQLSLQITLVVLELTLLDSLDSIPTKVEHLRKAANL